MNIEPYSLSQAQKDFNFLTIDSVDPRNLKVEQRYTNLRNSLVNARDDVFNELNLDEVGIDKKKYEFDLHYGVKIYEILKYQYKFSKRQLSDDDFWRFINVRVVPDILHSRWNFNKSYYYENSRRLYMKRIYWYIEIAWTGDAESTLHILEKNNTDVIASFVERPGLGYDVPVYREMLKQIASNNLQGRDNIRPLLKLNTARLKMISPSLVEGGITQYVKDLIEVINK